MEFRGIDTRLYGWTDGWCVSSEVVVNMAAIKVGNQYKAEAKDQPPPTPSHTT